MKVLIVTACGAKKNSMPMPAYALYKSARIKAVFNRRKACDMAILSSKYGLVKAQDIIEPYEQVMDEKRALELIPSVAEHLEEYDYIIFFKGGARRAYLNCIRAACSKIGKTLISFGFANMGGINNLPMIIDLVKRGGLDNLPKLEHLDVWKFSDD